MIFHYYGVKNFIKGEYYDEEDENQKDVIKHYRENKDCEILLGTILFDNLPEDQKEKYLNKYIEDYKKLAGIINKEYESENKVSFKMLKEPLTYSDSVIKKIISDLPVVRQYYFGE